MNPSQTHPAQTQPMAGWEKIVVALLVLGGAGGWTMARQDLAEKRTTAETTAQTRSKEIERLNGERTRLAAGSGLAASVGERAEAGSAAAGLAAASAAMASSGAAPTAAGPARTEAMMRLADLLEKGVLAGMPITPVTPGRPGGPALPPYAINAQGQLQPGFGQLFGLSDDQVGRLQEKITALKQQVESAAMAGTTVEQTGENTYSLTMQPLATAAQSRDELISTFKEALGEDGYRLFAALNGERVSAEGVHTGGPANLLAQFGAEPRTMTVTRGPNGFQYSFKSGNSGGSGNGADLTNLSARLGPAVNMLPSAFLTAPFPNRAGNGGAGGAGGGGRGGDSVMQFTQRTGEGETTTLRVAAPAAGSGAGDTFVMPAK